MNNKIYVSIGILIILLFSAYFIFNKFKSSSSLPQTKETTNETTDKNTKTSVECNGSPTIEVTEGPYYKSGSLEKNNLYESEIPGTKLTLTGYVLDLNCKPITHAWLDFWQADGDGNYDNSGYILRGHQYTDENGKYTLTTVIPGEYPGRTPHIHVKVRATDKSPILTTQLFVPAVATNETDNLYDKSLLMNIESKNDERIATFNFVLNIK